MATVTLSGNPCETSGALPEKGSKAPAFSLTGHKMNPVSLSDYAGTKLVLNILPSVDTGVCAASARAFDERAAGLDGTKVLTISADLPFAMARFSEAEGIDNIDMLSTFRDDAFGNDYGTTIQDGPFAGLHARAVVVLDAEHEVVYTQLVSEIGNEPDYDSALEAVTSA